jgi:hypothetical protein
VFDIVRAAGLDAGRAREVADAVAESGRSAKAAAPGPAPQGARLALVFQGVSVSFAAGNGSASVSVAEVSIKASLGVGSGDSKPGFGEARISVAVTDETVAVAAGNGTLEARAQELGVSLDATVAVDRLPPSGAAGTDGGSLGVTLPDGSSGQVSPASVTGLGFDLAVPLAGPSQAGLGGPAPVNVTV